MLHRLQPWRVADLLDRTAAESIDEFSVSRVLMTFILKNFRQHPQVPAVLAGQLQSSVLLCAHLQSWLLDCRCQIHVH